MKPPSNRPTELWNNNMCPRSVEEYFDAYMGEFDYDWVTSDYPYKGPASAFFRLLTKKVDPYESFARFENMGACGWATKHAGRLNPFTADLLAAAERLGGKLGVESSSSMPGGIGADSGDVWVSLLDGGVGVEVLIWQHQTTNHLHTRQCTTARGPRAYRALLELLGFDWINRKLPGEEVTPTHKEIIALVNDLLLERIP